MPLLDVQDCTKKFGGLTAVNDFTLSMNTGELVGLIGPNGAGKTTAFNLLTGVYAPTSGTHHLRRAGIAGPQALSDRRLRPVPHVSEHPPVSRR